jgi:hypothetical protein
MPSLT